MNNLHRPLFYLCIIFTLYSGTYSFDIEKVTQENENTCWAYASLSVLHWYGKLVSPQDIYDYATCGFNTEGGQACQASCKVCTVCRNSISDVLFHFGSISSNCPTTLYLHDIKNSIDNNRPIIAIIYKKHDKVAHAVVICKAYNSVIEYMDPVFGAYRPHIFEDFLDNENFTLIGAVVPTNSPGENFDINSAGWNSAKWHYYFANKPVQGYIKDEPLPPCEPWVGDGGCVQAGCSFNVHDIESKIWYANTEGNTFRYPVAFPKKGLYKITLKCRGSVCSYDGTIVGGCASFGDNYPKVLREVSNIAKVSLEGMSNNYINNSDKSAIITGSNLDRVVKDNDGKEVKCRAFTMSAPFVPGSIDFTTYALIREPGVVNVKIELLGNDAAGIVSFSLHDLSTEWVRGLIYGCMDQSACNYNPNTEEDNGSCLMPITVGIKNTIRAYNYRTDSYPINLYFEKNYDQNLYGPIDRYSWKCSDGKSSSNSSPTFEFASFSTARTVNVNVSFYTQNGGCGSGSAQITIPGTPPRIVLNYDQSEECYTFRVTDLANDPGDQIVSYDWTFFQSIERKDTRPDPSICFSPDPYHPIAHVKLKVVCKLGKEYQEELTLAVPLPPLYGIINPKIIGATNGSITYQFSLTNGSLINGSIPIYGQIIANDWWINPYGNFKHSYESQPTYICNRQSTPFSFPVSVTAKTQSNYEIKTQMDVSLPAKSDEHVFLSPVLYNFGIYGIDRVNINDRVTCRDFLISDEFFQSACGGPLTNGTFAMNIGRGAQTGSLFSKGIILLRDYAKVNGDVSSDLWTEFQNINTITITGSNKTYQGRHGIALPEKIAYIPLSFNDIPQTYNYIEPDKVYSLSPGKFWHLSIKSRSTLNLSTGSYYFNAFEMDYQSVLNLDINNGPVKIYVNSQFRFYADVNFNQLEQNGPANFMICYMGTNTASLRNFKGTFIAPNASIDAATGGYTGMFIAGKSITFHQDSEIFFMPFIEFPQGGYYH